MPQLDWEKLLSAKRRKDFTKGKELLDTGIGRNEFERDYDRVLFLAATRRLADKTQVFPMEANDSVRNRLTHSHEVSNLARSIGVRLVYNHREIVFKESFQNEPLERIVPPLLAATGLAHDLGNPPFGHQGELAIRQWFKTKAEDLKEVIHKDFLNFDGNCQTFRLLTKLQVLKDDFGLNLSCGTLAALQKYPTFHNTSDRVTKKWGIFESERPAATEVWEETGLSEGVRHPLAYVMEACDDIAYSVIDAEDTIKKGYASYYDLIEFLKEEEDETINQLIQVMQGVHSEFKAESISSAELNDLSMQMFRVKAIAQMIEDATCSFVKNIDAIMSGDIRENFELITNSDSADLCRKLKEFDKRHGFEHQDVLKLELEGNNYIKKTMNFLWMGIEGRDCQNPDSFAKYAYGRISENYRRVFEARDKTRTLLDDKCQLLCDAISGMTERYLIDLHSELSKLND